MFLFEVIFEESYPQKVMKLDSPDNKTAEKVAEKIYGREVKKVNRICQLDHIRSYKVKQFFPEGV